MSQIPGLQTLKELVSGTGKRQKELINEYRDLIGDSPEEGKKILKTILRIIRQEQFLRITIIFVIVVIVFVYAIALKFEKYIFTEGEVITKEKALAYLGSLDNRPSFNLKPEGSKLGIAKHDQIIGYLGTAEKDDFITILPDDETKSTWIAQTNYSADLKERILLHKQSGNLFPKTQYPAYEVGKTYPFNNLEKFWFEISAVNHKVIGNDSIYTYDILFGEGIPGQISWIEKPIPYTNTINGLGHINDSPPRVVERKEWKNMYVVFFGIGLFTDYRVYKIHSKAYALSIREKR